MAAESCLSDCRDWNRRDEQTLTCGYRVCSARSRHGGGGKREKVMIDPVPPRADTDTVGVAGRAAADDMSAIFGSATRGVTKTPEKGTPTRARTGGSNRIILAVSAATLAVTVAAGIYVGNSVVSVPVTAPAPNTGEQHSRSVELRDAVSRPAVADAGLVPTAPLPATAPVATPEARPSPVAPAVISVAQPTSHDIARSPATARLIPHPTSATAAPSDVATPPAPKRSDCDGDDNLCVAPHVEVAERRVAYAYEQAVRAGARSRDLRGYRGEWDRARNMAIEQPRAALRLYAMITSDLLNLADDAEARNDAAGQ